MDGWAGVSRVVLYILRPSIPPTCTIALLAWIFFFFKKKKESSSYLPNLTLRLSHDDIHAASMLSAHHNRCFL